MDENGTYLIYGLADPGDGAIFYVGRSCSGLKRPRQHWCPGNLAKLGDRPLGAILRRVLASGSLPLVRVLETCHEAEALNEAEIRWIANLRSGGVPLANRARGGTHGGGWKQSDEVRRRLSEINKGKVFSAETRRRASLSHKGYSLPEESRRKLAASKTGTRLSDEAKRKISAARAGRSWGRHTDETRAKISAARKGRRLGPQSAEVRQRASLALKQYFARKRAESDSG